MNRTRWAILIGNVIISMNEIDWMTHLCKKKIFKEAISRKWVNKSLANRLEYLHEKIASNELLPELRELKLLLIEAHVLCEFRNKIAHGSFVLNVDRSMATDRDGQLEIVTIGYIQAISEEELIYKAARCSEISGGISRQIFIAEMAMARK